MQIDHKSNWRINFFLHFIWAEEVAFNFSCTATATKKLLECSIWLKGVACHVLIAFVDWWPPNVKASLGDCHLWIAPHVLRLTIQENLAHKAIRGGIWNDSYTYYNAKLNLLLQFFQTQQLITLIIQCRKQGIFLWHTILDFTTKWLKGVLYFISRCFL